MDLDDVDGDTIERAGLKDKEFERFLKRLLRAERGLRHRPDAEVQGPVADYRGDDLRDLVFVVHGPPKCPRTEFTAALTWDDPGQTWYSCKGGGSWRSEILGELGQRAYNVFTTSGTKPSSKVRKRPPKVLLDHIERGGRYVFVISVRAIDDRGLRDEVAKQLKFWLEVDEDTRRSVPATLRAQLEFIDANRLGDFISTHRPELGAAARDALGLNEPPGLESWEQWTDELATGRDLPSFEADAQRDAVFEAIADRDKQVLRVFGPPGVGKTRVVHEGIRRCGEGDRTRYSDDVDVSLKVVQDAWLRRGGGPWLVLDELRSVDVEQVIAKFRANASESARLFLIGTSDAQARAIPGRQFELPPLDEAQTLSLIRSEAGVLPEAQLEAIWRLSEGYPWYAMLLAQAVAKDDPLLEHGDDDATRWHYGTQRVLAGHPRVYGSISEWEREAELRAKTLLVAMLTRDVELDWDELWERHGEALRLAIDEPTDWHEVKRRERVCRERQLLRQSGLRATRRYVSPNNLARIVLHHFLTDPDLDPQLRRHAPELRATLVEIAKAVRVKPAIIERLARGEWEELERRARQGVDAIEAYVRHDEACYKAARDTPEIAANTMAAIILQMSAQELAAAGNLREVSRYVFQHLIHRKLPPVLFLDVEAALLKLARADDGEATFANYARRTWMSLFLPALHATHQPWELRHGRLAERLASADSVERGLAIDALDRIIGPREHGLGYGEEDRADGDWPLPSEAELRERKAQLWTMLLRACEDEQLDLAARAQSVAARRVRGGLGRGLFVDNVARLAEQARAWSAATRRELLEAVTDVRRYDLDDYAEHPALLDGLTALERAAAPTDLRERVRAQFGTWHPGPRQINDPERPAQEQAADLELARELLADPASLSWALEWSARVDAHRARAMWVALGRVDRGAGVHLQLAHALEQGLPATALSEYLLGWADSTNAKLVEAWLFGSLLIESTELAQAAVSFLVFQAPTSTRLARIQRLIEQGATEPQALALLGYRGWAETLNVDAISSFMAGLSDTGELAELNLRLGLGLVQRELEPEQRDAVLELLSRSLRRLLERRIPSSAQQLVTRVGLVLAEAGELELVSSSLLSALDVSVDGGSNIYVGHELLAKLLREGHAEALWSVLADALLEREGVGSWQLADDRFLAHVPVSTILSWVGDDQRRARMVAGLTSPHDEDLDPVVRELLLRFGAEGEIAARLQSRALSSPGVVGGGFVNFERRQLDNAAAWAKDVSPQVRAWAQRIEALLMERIVEHDARVELRAKYG